MQENPRRIDRSIMNADGFWAESVADHVLEALPNEEVYTCSAGISPSGIVHFGNFRDVATSLAVAQALKARGKNVRFLFVWDDFDRFRKVPTNVDASFEQHIGLPLSAVPDPEGKLDSYAAHFEKIFEASMKEADIDIEFRSQTEFYKAGEYDQRVKTAMQHRDKIANILLSFMSEKAKMAKGIVDDEYRAAYYPVNVYSTFTGKDNTEILSYDGETSITYRCLDTNQEETIDFTQTRNVKLEWKTDWAMRWAHEGVSFEPAGKDHAAPQGSYNVSSVIAREVFGAEPPFFIGYEFVGIQGLGGKMSGSKGNAVSVADLLEIYEPSVLKWLYMRKRPNQAFQLAFDSEIYRQYTEFDRQVAALGRGELDASQAAMLRYSGIETLSQSEPIPFKQIVALGQMMQWDRSALDELLERMGEVYDPRSIDMRLPRAKAWLETYNPDAAIVLREEVNAEYAASMSEESKGYVKQLREALEGEFENLEALNTLVYDIPKDEALEKKENSIRQRNFFKDIYNLLLGTDQGPRLSTFLWAIDRDQVLRLLTL